MRLDVGSPFRCQPQALAASACGRARGRRDRASGRGRGPRRSPAIDSSSDIAASCAGVPAIEPSDISSSCGANVTWTLTSSPPESSSTITARPAPSGTPRPARQRLARRAEHLDRQLAPVVGGLDLLLGRHAGEVVLVAAGEGGDAGLHGSRAQQRVGLDGGGSVFCSHVRMVADGPAGRSAGVDLTSAAQARLQPRDRAAPLSSGQWRGRSAGAGSPRNDAASRPAAATTSRASSSRLTPSAPPTCNGPPPSCAASSSSAAARSSTWIGERTSSVKNVICCSPRATASASASCGDGAWPGPPISSDVRTISASGFAACTATSAAAFVAP